MGEPHPVNPNSFSNIACILRKIGKRAGVKKYCEEGTRKWIFVENDSGIYTILIKLIKNDKCLQCSESFFGFYGGFVQHAGNFKYKFDWLIPIPVLLHIVINAARAFMPLNWDVFIEEVAEAMDFTSESALKWAKKGEQSP